MINEQFIDRVINILLEMRLDEVGPVKAANKAKVKAWKGTLPKSKTAKTVSPENEAGVSAKALIRATAARTGKPQGEEGPAKKPDTGEAKYQVSRSKRMDKPQLP